MQSEADGHTILFGTTGNLAVNPVLYAGRPGMNMERDFAPLSHVASLAFVLVANPSVPAKSLQELIELAKSKPGEMLYGSSGNGGLPHLSGELAEPPGRTSASGTCRIAAARRCSPT